MGKRSNSVMQLVKEISTTKSFKKKFAEEIQNKSVAKFLFSLRCGHKLTQKQLAGKIRCSQSRVSKIESSYNQELTIKDLIDYANALNLQVELGCRSPSVKIVDLIKYHAFKIKLYLEQLTKLAEEDKVLNEGVKQFHGETVYNLIKITLDSLSKLNISKKEIHPRKKEQIYISDPIDIKEINQIKKLEQV